jgi:hypothetical protein
VDDDGSEVTFHPGTGIVNGAGLQSVDPAGNGL